LDTIRNVNTMDRLRQEGVLEFVRRRQQNWKQMLEEMSNNRAMKKVHDGEIQGRCPQGRPRHRRDQ